MFRWREFGRPRRRDWARNRDDGRDLRLDDDFWELEPSLDERDRNWGWDGHARLRQRENRQNGPPHRQENVIFVSLPVRETENETGLYPDQARFIINRDVLYEYLPRARHAVRRGSLDLERFLAGAIYDANPPDMITGALRTIFRHLQELNRPGHISLFDNARNQISTEPNRLQPLLCWAARLLAICIVLHNERGLGCGEDLLRDILSFMEYVSADVHNFLGYRRISILFEALSGIFRATRPEYVDQLRRVWDGFDPELQEQLLHDMRAVEDIDLGAGRVYDALQRRHRPVRRVRRDIDRAW